MMIFRKKNLFENKVIVKGMIILFSCITYCCQSERKVCNGVTLEEIDTSGLFYSSRDVLWKEDKTGKSFVSFYMGPATSLSGSKTTYVLITRNGVYELKSDHPFDVNGDWLYFYKQPYGNFGYKGNQWYEVEGNVFGRVDTLTDSSFIEIYRGKIIKSVSNEFKFVGDVNHFNSIYDIKENGLYYVGLPGIGVFHEESLRRLKL